MIIRFFLSSHLSLSLFYIILRLTYHILLYINFDLSLLVFCCEAEAMHFAATLT